MADKIPCFAKVNMPDLAKLFDSKYKEGMSESEQRQIGTDIALEYHKQLHEELNTFKKSIKAPTTAYVSPDKSEAIKAINDQYSPKIAEAKLNEKGVSLTKIQSDANDIITGKKVFERFSQEEQHGLTDGGANHVEAALILAANEKTGRPDNPDTQLQESNIEDYARSKGIWYGNTTTELTNKLGEQFKSGEEAVVWRSEDGTKVVKSQSTDMYGGDLQQKLDGITLHNLISPEAPLKVIGFGRDAEGNFNVVVEQPFIHSDNSGINDIGNPAQVAKKQKLIKEYLGNLGFENTEGSNYSNGEILLEDVHNGNAIITPKGNVVIIDPISRLNNPEQGYGGTRKIKNEVNEANANANTENKQSEQQPKEEIKPDEASTETGEGAGQKPPPSEPGEAVEGGEGKPSGIRKALVSDEIIKGVDLERVGDKEMMALGRKILDSGEVKPAALVQKIITEKSGVLKPAEVVGLITYKADVDNALSNAYKEYNRRKDAGEDTGTLGVEIKDLERQIEDFDVMAIITANQQSMAFRLRQYMLDRNYNLVDQIERYKKNNNGYIPEEVEAKFRELDKQLKEVKGKLKEAEQKLDEKVGQKSVDNIKESVDRENKYTDEEIEKKIQEGVESEISKLYEQLPADKKSVADKAIAALEKFRKKLRGDGSKTYSSLAAIPIGIADTGALVAIRAIKVGKSAVEAVRIAVKRMKDLMKEKGIEVKDWEEKYTKDLTDFLESEGVSTKKPPKDTATINEDGSISIPNEMIRGMVKKGVTDINDITDAVHKEVVEDLPEITKRQVRDYITDYGKKVNQTADEIQTQVNTAKRVGRLLSELEDLQNKIKKQTNPANKNKLTEQERELKRHISLLEKSAGVEETAEQKNLKRLEKKLDELLGGVVENPKEKRGLSEREKDLSDQISEAKKNLGLIKSKAVKTDTKHGLEDLEAKEQNKIKALEKQLDDLRQGIVKEKSERTEDSDEVKSLKEEIYDAKKNLGLFKPKKVASTPNQLQITETEKKIERLEKEKANLEAGIVRQNNVSSEKPSPQQQEKLDALKEDIYELKKNLGLFKSKEIKQPLTDEQKLELSKQRVRDRIAELDRKIRHKNFAKPTKKLPVTDNELAELNKQKEKLQEEFENEQYKNDLKNRTGWQKVEDVAKEATSGLIRGLVASLDVSAVFVQGTFRLMVDLGKSGWQLITLRKPSPNRSLNAVVTMLKHLVSQKYSDDYLAKIKSSQKYPLMKASKVALDDKSGHVSAKEGFFISNWINLIWNHAIAPGLSMPISIFTKGNIRKGYDIAKAINPYLASQRAFDGYVNSIRANAFSDFANKLEHDGYTFESDPKVFQKAADVINTTTGRGSLGKADANSSWLNIFFFAPRKVISEVKLFTPYAFAYYGRMPKPVRNKALKDLGVFLGAFTTANALMWASNKPDDDDEDGMKIWKDFWNPNSSNFLTHKIGGKRVSIGGGAKSMIVFQSRLLTGKFVDQYGKGSKLGDRFGKQINTRWDLMTNFLAGKTAPAINVAIQKAQERKGLEVDDAELIRDVTIPIWMQDLKEMYKNDPTTVNIILTALSLFGANARAVDEKKSNSTFTPEDQKDPTIKYFLDKGVELPGVNMSREVHDSETNSKIKLNEAPKEKQEKYIKEWKDGFIAKSKIAKQLLYFIDKYGDVSKEATAGSQAKKFSELTPEQMKKVLSEVGSEASEGANKKVFPK